MNRVLAAAAILLAPAAADAAEIGRIRAHLVYEETGRLSADLLTAQGMALWNTIIGEGDAEEMANDLLILVEVLGAGAQQEFIEEPLEIGVRRDESFSIGRPRGRVNRQRRFESLLTSDEGRVWKALYLPDAGCAGRLEISATIGRSTRRATLDLVCGE
jgi:hypothetical protein